MMAPEYPIMAQHRDPDDPSAPRPAPGGKTAPPEPGGLTRDDSVLVYRGLYDLREEVYRGFEKGQQRLDAMERSIGVLAREEGKRNAFWARLSQSFTDKPFQWLSGFALLVVTVAGVAAGQLPIVVQLIQNVTK